jgi:hypothetical protein
MHERLKGIEVRRLELGGVAASRWLRGHITGGAIAGEEVTDTTQTEPEARGSLPHRALVRLVSVYHPQT